MCSIIWSGSPFALSRLSEGLCPTCETVLIRHEHPATTQSNEPYFNPLPTEPYYGACPKGCGDWRLEEGRIYFITFQCHTKLIDVEEGYLRNAVEIRYLT